jgi:hypothetical protein
VCGGRVRLDQTSGFISDGNKNYTADQQCTWLIDGRRHGNQSVIRLKFVEFETECNWDHLYVFKGDSMYAPLVAAFSGILARRSQTAVGLKLPDIEIEGGLAYLYFYSDTAYFMSGFNLSYQVLPCKSGKCADMNTNDSSPVSLTSANEAIDSEYDSSHCSLDRSFRNESNCNCNDGLNSLRCSHLFCPNKCSLHGDCDSTGRRCVCNEGFAGADCGQIQLEGYWEALNYLKKQTVLGRSLHQATVVHDQMYVIGGEFFELSKSSEQFLMRFDFTTDRWTNITHVFHDDMRRFGHTVVAHGSQLYMFGGINSEGTVLADLWTFSTVDQQWTLIAAKSTHRNCHVELCAPLAVIGHSATLVGDRMYAIFGYNPRFGYLNTIQEYSFDTKQWTVLNPGGALVKGGFGHSSVYHANTHMIYVYGGHHSAGSDSVLVDHLYGYSFLANKWFVFNVHI